MDLSCAVSALPVANGNVADFQVQLPRAKQKVEVPKRIEVTELDAILRNSKIVSAEECLRAAQRVFDGLPEHPRECEAEELVGAHIQESHRLLIHGIDQPNAIRKLGVS